MTAPPPPSATPSPPPRTPLTPTHRAIIAAAARQSPHAAIPPLLRLLRRSGGAPLPAPVLAAVAELAASIPDGDAALAAARAGGGWEAAASAVTALCRQGRATDAVAVLDGMEWVDLRLAAAVRRAAGRAKGGAVAAERLDAVLRRARAAGRLSVYKQRSVGGAGREAGAPGGVGGDSSGCGGEAARRLERQLVRAGRRGSLDAVRRVWVEAIESGVTSDVGVVCAAVGGMVRCGGWGVAEAVEILGAWWAAVDMVRVGVSPEYYDDDAYLPLGGVRDRWDDAAEQNGDGPHAAGQGAAAAAAAATATAPATPPPARSKHPSLFTPAQVGALLATTTSTLTATTSSPAVSAASALALHAAAGRLLGRTTAWRRSPLLATTHLRLLYRLPPATRPTLAQLDRLSAHVRCCVSQLDEQLVSLLAALALRARPEAGGLDGLGGCGDAVYDDRAVSAAHHDRRWAAVADLVHLADNAGVALGAGFYAALASAVSAGDAATIDRVLDLWEVREGALNGMPVGIMATAMERAAVVPPPGWSADGGGGGATVGSGLDADEAAAAGDYAAYAGSGGGEEQPIHGSAAGGGRARRGWLPVPWRPSLAAAASATATLDRLLTAAPSPLPPALALAAARCHASVGAIDAAAARVAAAATAHAAAVAADSRDAPTLRHADLVAGVASALTAATPPDAPTAAWAHALTAMGDAEALTPPVLTAALRAVGRIGTNAAAEVAHTVAAAAAAVAAADRRRVATTAAATAAGSTAGGSRGYRRRGGSLAPVALKALPPPLGPAGLCALLALVGAYPSVWSAARPLAAATTARGGGNDVQSAAADWTSRRGGAASAAASTEGRRGWWRRKEGGAAALWAEKDGGIGLAAVV
ncbi:hypothetical protein MMPV_006455 [Pyropia vietnamensis]